MDNKQFYDKLVSNQLKLNDVRGILGDTMPPPGFQLEMYTSLNGHIVINADVVGNDNQETFARMYANPNELGGASAISLFRGLTVELGTMCLCNGIDYSYLPKMGGYGIGHTLVVSNWREP